MATNKTPLRGILKEHQKDLMDIDEQKYDTIAKKTTAAITVRQQTPPVVNNGPPPPPPPGQQQPPSKSHPARPKNFSRARCLMFFPTSGRMGFETVKMSDELPPIETLREMIAYETRIRLSEPVQELMDLYHDDEAALTLVLDLIQQHVVEYFGYHHVNALRTALHRFPDETTVKSAFYVKHNKTTQGLIEQGQCVRDVNLFTLEGQPTTLFSQITAGQPLVLLAGSTSWPPFLASVERMNALFRSHAPNGMRLLVIYIAEAHARDQWPMGKIISCVDQPKTLEQRLDNARQCKKNVKFEMPMLVDNMDDTFHLTYGSWPFRFYVIYEGKLALKGEPNKKNFTYDMDDLDAWITNFYQSRNPVA